MDKWLSPVQRIIIKRNCVELQQCSNILYGSELSQMTSEIDTKLHENLKIDRFLVTVESKLGSQI
jgi:hypothetical protein